MIALPLNDAPAQAYITILESKIVALQQENKQLLLEHEGIPSTLKRRIEELEAELSQQREECSLLRKRLRLRDEVDATEHKPAFKVIANALVKHLEGHEIGDYKKVEAREIAEATNMPVPTVRKYISQADKIGIVSKRKETVQLADEKGYRTSMFLARTPLLDEPRFWTPPDEQETKQHGGKRAGAGRKPKCEHCGSERIDPLLTYQCLDCGQPTNILLADLPKEMQPHVDAFLSFLAGGVDGVKIQDESSLALEELEDDWNEDEAESENEPESRVIFQDESSLADDRVNDQNESLITYKEDAQIETSLPSEEVKIQDESSLHEVFSPSSPPIADDATPLERDAVHLLLEIAGTANEHIIMNRDEEKDGKYITIHHKPHYGDMKAHLRGYQTKGAYLHHPYGNTLALCFDADDSQAWQLLKEAGLLLAQAGFKVILEESPVQKGAHAGGGHLWVIFDKLVDAYCARQTMIDIAPMLDSGIEYFPAEGKRVRLPGGKYVTPNGFQAWCKLYDAYGTELSHDGDGVAATLLAMQSSAALVKKHEKKTELVLMPQPTRSTPKPEQGGYLDKDVSQYVISEFNATHSWDEIAALAGGFDKREYFPACWRGDGRVNAVYVHTDTDRAVDYGASSWLGRTPMDQYQVWCLIQGGVSWEAFKKQDLDQRCKEYRLNAKRVVA